MQQKELFFTNQSFYNILMKLEINIIAFFEACGVLGFWGAKRS